MFIEDMTRTTFEYLNNPKNEVLAKFKKFRHPVGKTRVEKIKRFRSDNGIGEYANSVFKA